MQTRQFLYFKYVAFPINGKVFNCICNDLLELRQASEAYHQYLEDNNIEFDDYCWPMERQELVCVTTAEDDYILDSLKFITSTLSTYKQNLSVDGYTIYGAHPVATNNGTTTWNFEYAKSNS